MMLNARFILWRFSFLYIIFFSLLSFGQEFPPVATFTPQDYGAEDQNWDISQGINKNIYVANNKGLLVYNGARWQLYNSPNETIIRSVKVFEDKIYTGSYMDFGVWKTNTYGSLEYTSLSEKVSKDLIEDEEFWEIIKLDDWVLFQSFDRIYIYNTIEEDFKIIDSSSRIIKIYNIDDTIYYQKINDGIFKIENGTEKLVINHEVLNNQEVVNIFKNNNELLIQTREDGFYTFSNQNLQRWDIEANSLLSNISVYSSIKLKDGSFVLGTISNGFVQLSTDGKVLLQIDQSEGLGNNTVLSVFEDVSGNIWLGLDNGITVVNLSSPFKVYHDNQGVLGTIYTSAKTDTHLYLGTNQGLFYKALNEDNGFNLVEGTKGQVWFLDVIDKQLFCCHDKGTFIVSGNTVSKISNEKGTWTIKQLEAHPNLLLQGNYKGLSVLENRNGKWIFRNKIEGFDISSRFIESIAPNEILVNHEHKGVYSIVLNSDFTKVLDYKKTSVNEGANSSIIKYNDKILYTYKEGVFFYDNVNSSFKKDSVLSTIFSGENYLSGKLISDQTGNKLWGFTNDEIIYLESGKLTDKPEVKRIPFSNEIRKSKSGYENILYLDDDKYLLGTTTGYLIVDLDEEKNNSNDNIKNIIHLNAISYNALHNEFVPLDLNQSISLKNKNNNIQFKYSVSDYNKLSSSLYQYRLIGIYDNWSNWSSNSEVIFENLPHGNYKFEARSLTGGKLSNNKVSVDFEIEKPWYLKPLAIAAYVLLFLTSAFLVHYFNKRYYKKQKQKLIQKKERELKLEQLENQRQLVQFKNKNLKLDIENKNRELGIATMNLVRRNELLNTIKEALSSAKPNAKVKNVVKLINSNLNSTNDWELFEEAFNNVDKDFMKRVKSLHPSITPNDLRLCTYLRLNLSSKEIAPLLNISHKSVEVKRYRLRKKMGLAHNESLTNYILEM